MENLDKITDLLKKIGEFFVVISAALVALGNFFKRLTPAIKLLALLASQVIPNGAIIWRFLYLAAENAARLTEPNIFLSMVGQELALILIYNLIWGIWLYPRLKKTWFTHKKETEPKSEPGAEPTPADPKKRSKARNRKSLPQTKEH